MKVLCISNGHGEDEIALRILNAMRQCDPTLRIFALPIAGTGRAYEAHNIPLIGSVQALPSGGFLNRDVQQLTRDLKQGLLSLTQQQLKSIKAWATAADPNDSILAVGDIVPLLFAWRTQQPYHFIGTAKSEYWLRDESGKLPATGIASYLEGWSGSVYLPWERWLMSRDRCQSVFVRDALTAQHLRSLGLRADYAGNPMMDSLAPTGQLTPLLDELRQSFRAGGIAPSDSASEKATALYVTSKQQPALPLLLTLLPGSRQPEAYENWARILSALPSLIKSFHPRPLVLLSAIAPSLSLEKLRAPLQDAWKTVPTASPYLVLSYKNITLALINDAYSDCLHRAEIAIATAGTATEQFVGLGKPAITLPGPGPQFTSAFATVQAKMLGPSIQIIHDPNKAGEAIQKTISDLNRLQLIYQNGTHRMGKPGAGERIAKKILERMNDER